jgi:hypothetical protein
MQDYTGLRETLGGYLALPSDPNAAPFRYVDYDLHDQRGFQLRIVAKDRAQTLVTIYQDGFEIGGAAPPPPAPKGAIEGTVTRYADGSPIAGATVTAGSLSTSTGPDGAYSFSGLDPGSYLVTASAPGYQGDSTTVEVAASATARANFSLRRVPTQPPVLTATAAGFDIILLRWGELTEATVYRLEMTSPESQVLYEGPYIAQFEHTGLEQGRPYRYRAYAGNEGGWSDPSPEACDVTWIDTGGNLRIEAFSEKIWPLPPGLVVKEVRFEWNTTHYAFLSGWNGSGWTSLWGPATGTGQIDIQVDPQLNITQLKTELRRRPQGNRRDPGWADAPIVKPRVSP